MEVNLFKNPTTLVVGVSAAYVLINNIISSMQGIKKPNIAVYIGFYRQILMPLIVFNLLGNVLELKVLGVWWGIVIINWSAVIILIVYEKYRFKNLENNIND